MTGFAFIGRWTTSSPTFWLCSALFAEEPRSAPLLNTELNPCMTLLDLPAIERAFAKICDEAEIEIPS